MLQRLNARPDRALPALIALSILLRAAAAVFAGNEVEALPGAADQLSYHELALRVLGGYGFTFGKNWWPMTAAGAPTAHWSFLYTGYLAAVYALARAPLAARLLQAALVGALQVWLAFRIGERVFDRRVGLAAAAVTALYAYFIYYAGTLMTEPFYVTAVLGVLYLAIELAAAEEGAPLLRRSIAFGAALGVAVLLRQVFLLFVPFLFLWLWFAQTSRSLRSRFLAAALPAAVLTAMILPVTFYNAGRFDRFVLLNTNAGYAFFLANHPIHGTDFIPARENMDYQALIPPELHGLDEAALDSALLTLGLQFVREDPQRYLLLSIDRIPEFFKFWPAADSGLVSNVARVASFGLALPWMAAGIFLWARRPRTGGAAAFLREPGTLLLAFAFVYTLVHILSWALVRYRLPVDAVLVVFAAHSIAAFAERSLLNRSAPAALVRENTSPGGS